MLPQANRLKHWRDFKAVYQKGIRRYGRHLTVRGLQLPRVCSDNSQVNPPDLPPTRIGISVSQKVSKKAVVRNRLKRRIRAALRQLLPRLTPGWHVIVGVRPNALECEYAQFLQELEQLLVDAEVINGH
ncbi:MAG: ribonuclease P protein component [Coleofasciculus sp. B1-GNL1-01]|uniref:ribonuclease P protein component n=1 Tax=Coleofasciculus sp. B1-GNL1-01 TaxID=3068484 RepID=UPI0033023113